MQPIVLTEEQLRSLRESNGTAEVQDEQGRTVAHLTLLSQQDIEAIERHKRRRGQPREPGIPSDQVQAHLRRLEEIRQAEGMDLPKALELLRRMRAGEQV